MTISGPGWSLAHICPPRHPPRLPRVWELTPSPESTIFFQLLQPIVQRACFFIAVVHMPSITSDSPRKAVLLELLVVFLLTPPLRLALYFYSCAVFLCFPTDILALSDANR